MTITTMDKVHAACTVVPRLGGDEPSYLQSPVGCSLQRFVDDSGELTHVATLPGTYLIHLDYPLDPLSCAHTCETFLDLELSSPFSNPLTAAVLLHIDDKTKVLVTLGQDSEGSDQPIDTPFHFACWNTQANRGALYEMTVADPSILPEV